jgi:hypothetical protein
VYPTGDYGTALWAKLTVENIHPDMATLLQRVGDAEHKNGGVQIAHRLLQGDRAHCKAVAQHDDGHNHQYHQQIEPCQ